MSDLVPVRRALISVSDKAGLAEFASALVHDYHVELISTGGTAKFLRDAGLAVKDVSEVTGFPEMMDGRVKTLHPKIHGGLLALRDDPHHVKSMQEHDIQAIDLVVINLYPFKKTIEKAGVTFEEAIENIDIGGPSMVRSAAKNHRFVLVVTDPARYDKVLGDLKQHGGASCGKHRLKMAQQAFDHTAKYDQLIADYLQSAVDGRQSAAEGQSVVDGRSSVADEEMPASIELKLVKKQVLRYGENPHQKAALYVPAGSSPATDDRPPTADLSHAIQHHGKELSYINLLDADGALNVVREFAEPAACVVKHATPCGVATADSIDRAFVKAYECDPLAAFGGIVALNRKVDLATAEAIVAGQKFLEVIVSPGYEADALELLKQRWKNVRLLEIAEIQRSTRDDQPSTFDYSMHKVDGGFLIQESDRGGVETPEWKVVSVRQPTSVEMANLKFAWLACKHVKSNAIVIAHDNSAIGIGGGQVDRANAARVAIQKSEVVRGRLKESAAGKNSSIVAASDAFFPFPDGPKLLLDAGVTAIVQPGKSMRDQETIDLVNERGAAMIFTGERHFRH